MFKRFIEKKFRADSLALIEYANRIVAEYQQQGYRLTLRQLYYQFVARDLLANTVKNYKRLGGILGDARLAGMLDWDAIEDRTRNLHALSHWDEVSDIVESAAFSYRMDKWATQPVRIEVWVEKEALAGVFRRACDGLAVPLMSCRGYMSLSEMFDAGQRIRHRRLSRGQPTRILHFGDHDPSGIDMTRDIEERLGMFAHAPVTIERLALNFDQIEQYDPPPNPAKETDSRFEGYAAQYGEESWELDALEPRVLAQLVRDNVTKHMDVSAWNAAVREEAERRAFLKVASEEWEAVAGWLRDEYPNELDNMTAAEVARTMGEASDEEE